MIWKSTHSSYGQMRHMDYIYCVIYVHSVNTKHVMKQVVKEEERRGGELRKLTLNLSISTTLLNGHHGNCLHSTSHL